MPQEEALWVLARAERWIVVAKPPGIVVHRSAHTRERRAVLQILRDQLGRRVYPVHRLDRPTSGCLLHAFDPQTAGRLQEALRQGEKRYLAFVRGAIASREEVVVRTPMKDSRGVLKDAETRVRCVGSSADPRCSLVLARPSTGRFHQVRRHIRDLSHPVLGDSMHGDTRVNRWWREQFGLPRLGLHCLSLELTFEGERVSALCPVPRDLRQVWERMPWWTEAVERVPELQQPPGAGGPVP